MSTPAAQKVILIAHNLRSCHNVGSLLRTAEGLGVQEVILSGYTPYPALPPSTVIASDSMPIDRRMPHIVAKLSKQIHKTALGAEAMIAWRHEPDIFPVLQQLRATGWHVAAVEQAADSISLPYYLPPAKLVLIVGREVEGIESEVLAAVDTILEIPMAGHKESFNVVQAAAMALYHCLTTRN